VNFIHSGFNDCQSCPTPPGGHFPGQCSNCHNTDNWGDVNFSHAGLTNCNTCHSPPNDDDHEPPVPQCSNCHNTEDWDEVEDDDDKQAGLIPLETFVIWVVNA
jgi:hypothetical protein